MRLIFFICHLILHLAEGNHEQRLIARLLKNYNKEIRPIRNVSEVIQVRFYMTLQQMISVVEKVRNFKFCIRVRKVGLILPDQAEPRSRGIERKRKEKIYILD